MLQVQSNFTSSRLAGEMSSAWTERVLGVGRFRPAYYAHTQNAQQIYDDVRAVFDRRGIEATRRSGSRAGTISTSIAIPRTLATSSRPCGRGARYLGAARRCALADRRERRRGAVALVGGVCRLITGPTGDGNCRDEGRGKLRGSQIDGFGTADAFVSPSFFLSPPLAYRRFPSSPSLLPHPPSPGRPPSRLTGRSRYTPPRALDRVGLRGC